MRSHWAVAGTTAARARHKALNGIEDSMVEEIPVILSQGLRSDARVAVQCTLIRDGNSTWESAFYMRLSNVGKAPTSMIT